MKNILGNIRMTREKPEESNALKGPTPGKPAQSSLLNVYQPGAGPKRSDPQAIPNVAKSANIRPPTSDADQLLKPPTSLLGVVDKQSSIEGNLTPPDLRTLQDAIRHDKDNPRFVFKKQQYQFVRTIGSGTYATVKEAHWLPTGESVAVKMIDKSRMKDHAERLKTEIEILTKIKHPNLLRLIDWGFGKKTIYLVTEYATGGELFDRVIEQGHFYERDAAAVVKTILEAVGYLHSLNIVHRDLKPENIFLREKNSQNYTNLVIGDFGISRILDQQHRFLKTTIGSFGYMAPEVLMSKPYGKPCDLWSIGVIAYVLLSGTAPYKGGDFDKDLEDIMRHRLSFELPVWKDVSAAAKDFITNMLKINPAHRLTIDQALQHPWITRVGRRVSRPANIDPSGENSAQLLSTSPDLYPNVRDGLDAHRTQKLSSKLGLNREATFSDDEDFDSRGPSASSSPSNETGDISDALKSVKLLPK